MARSRVTCQILLMTPTQTEPATVARALSTRAQLERTDWARRFKADAPVSYKQAIDLAMQPGLRVFLRHTDENGEPMWAICAEEVPDFWMDAFEKRPAAVALCKAMGWKVVRA